MPPSRFGGRDGGHREARPRGRSRVLFATRRANQRLHRSGQPGIRRSAGYPFQPPRFRDTGRAMSQENVEIVRRGFEHANRRDLDGFLSYLDPEFELRSAVVGGAEGNVYRGPDGVREWLANLDETFEELINEPIELRDLGDRVLAFGRIRARGRES